MAVSTLYATYVRNLSVLRQQPLAEISGALGDLGTFLPIVIALAEGGQISLSTTLVFSGLFNVLTGVFFGIPLPVQPMKAIAAVAILKDLSAGQVASAGIFVSACILGFSITGLLKWFAHAIPVPVVKGIQVGAGLSLVIAAGGKALGELTWTGPEWSNNYFLLLLAFIALLGSTKAAIRIPYALIITLIGLVFAGIQVAEHHDSLPAFSAWRPKAAVPTGKEWSSGILDAGIGQLPLTTLNSVIAVVYLAADLFSEVETPSVAAIGISVAAMNLSCCWLGAMPMCHGSGGLAAQYRFGARSGASIIVLGISKLFLGLLFGESLMAMLHRFPTAFLTIMVIAAGLELANVGESLNTDRARDFKEHSQTRDETLEAVRKERWTVMLMTAGFLIAFKNDGIGFMAGMCCHWSYRLQSWRPHSHQSRGRDDPRETEAFLPSQR